MDLGGHRRALHFRFHVTLMSWVGGTRTRLSTHDIEWVTEQS